MTIDKHMFIAVTTNNNYINHIHQAFLHLPTAPSLLEKAAKVQSLTPTKAWMPGWPNKNQQKKWNLTKEKQDLPSGNLT